jgi:sec-independent protein translocase protein TatC
MDSADNNKGARAPEPEHKTPAEAESAAHGGEPHVAHEGTNDATDSYSYYDDYGYEQHSDSPAAVEQSNLPVPSAGSPPAPPTPPAKNEKEEEPDEDGMLRMSFLEHLEELRFRLVRMLMGIGVAFVLSLWFTDELWKFIQGPFQAAMAQNGVKDAKLVITTPMEAFSIIWMKLPIICAIFMASPWVLYQIWSFIAPGLYKKERRWAAPFVICSAGLFVAGGVFAYFVAFRLGLAFLLGIGLNNNLTPMVSVSEYFDLFVNVSLGMGLVFELPVLIFFLSLLRILTPQFLVRNSRYAILLIVIVAAIITPTPDIVNLMLVSVPMLLLYFVGVFASYLLYLSREGKRFPWKLFFLIVFGILAVTGGSIAVAIWKFGLKLVQTWPFFVR